MIFATEIVEKILYHVDAVTFATVSSVCKQWYDVVSKYKNKWKQFCELEIESGILKQLIDQYAYNDKFTDSMYYNIYKNWYICKKLENNKAKYSVTDVDPNKRINMSIIDFTVYRDYLFIVSNKEINYFSNKGVLQTIWSTSDDNIEKCGIFEFPTEDGKLQDDDFVFKSFFVVLQSQKLFFIRYDTPTNKFWKIEHTQPNIVFFKIHKNVLIVINRRNIVFTYEYTADLELLVYRVLRIYESVSIQDVLLRESNVVSVIASSGVLYETDHPYGLVGQVFAKYVLPLPVNTNLLNAYIFNEDFMMAISSQGSVVLANKNEFISFDCQQHFGANVTAMALFINTLVLGLTSGEICIYYITNFHQFMDTQFPNYNMRIKVSDNPIRQIVISETKKGPAIFVLAENNIHLIQLC